MKINSIRQWCKPQGSSERKRERERRADEHERKNGGSHREVRDRVDVKDP